MASQLTGLAMIACGVLSLACGVVLFVGRHPRDTLQMTVPPLPPTAKLPATAPDLADTWPSLPQSAHAPVQPPAQAPHDDDDEAPTQRRSSRKASFIQVSSEPWSWVEAVCGGYVREHVDDDE